MTQAFHWIERFAGWVVLGVAFLSALGWLWRRGRAMLRKIDKKLDELRAVADFVRAEMVPNHGSSLRDAVDRLEKGQKATTEGQQATEVRLASVETRLTSLEARPFTINVTQGPPSGSPAVAASVPDAAP